MTDLLDHPIALVLALAVAIFGGARLTRILVHDTFPPAAWIRAKWGQITAQPDGSDGSWAVLFACHFCMGVWIAAAVVGTYWLGTEVHWVAVLWWVLWGILALGYLQALVVEHDQHEEPGE